jgi:CheY-like chemotaxis protein
VLLVEDEAGQRDALRQLLEDQGHAVRTAGSADAGLRVLAEWEPPDLIVSDLRLPGPMDGRAFILAARKELGREIPALIVTGDTAPERLKHLAGLGVRVLHKPYRPGDLLAAMAELACPVR